jgi:hypothetical protein
LTPTNHQHSGFSSKQHSFTGDVLRAIRPLTYFSISEQHLQTASPALFFTPEVVEALQKHPALKSLSISMSQEPDDGILEATETFLRHSAVEHLEFDFPDIDPKVLEQHDLLSDCLKDFWIRVPSMAKAFDILYPIFESREAGDLPALRRVVLVREVCVEEWKDYTNEKADEEGKDSGKDIEVDTSTEITGQVNVLTLNSISGSLMLPIPIRMSSLMPTSHTRTHTWFNRC